MGNSLSIEYILNHHLSLDSIGGGAIPAVHTLNHGGGGTTWNKQFIMVAAALRKIFTPVGGAF